MAALFDNNESLPRYQAHHVLMIGQTRQQILPAAENQTLNCNSLQVGVQSGNDGLLLLQVRFDAGTLGHAAHRFGQGEGFEWCIAQDSVCHRRHTGLCQRLRDPAISNV